MKQLRDHYDWIVLGDHPGALLSAGLVAKMGLSVLVVPLSHQKSVWTGGNRVLIDLESNYFLGLGGSPDRPSLLSKCLDYLGMDSQQRAQIRPDFSMPQVLTKAGRISLFPDAEALSAEFDREFGKSASEKIGAVEAFRESETQFREFWLHYPESLTMVRSPKDGKMQRPASAYGALQLERFARAARKRKGSKWFSTDLEPEHWAEELSSPELAELAEGIWAGLSGSHAPKDLRMFDVLHLMALSPTGASMKGGLSSYRDALLKIAKANGADLHAVQSKAECKRIFIQNGKFSGVLLAGGGSVIGANGGILGQPWRSAQKLFAHSGAGWLRKKWKPATPQGWKFTVAIVVKEEAIPPGMTPRVICQDEGAPYCEIEVVNTRDYGAAAEEKVPMVFVRTILPFTEESLKPEYQRLIAAKLLRKLTDTCPFLEFYVGRIFPDFRAKPDELKEVYGFESLNEIPPQLLCYGPNDGTGAQSGVEGLFLASQESFPRYGTLGSTIAALEASAWIAHRSGLPGPFKS